MPVSAAAGRGRRKAVLVRAVLFFLAWCALGQVAAADLAMGAVAALASAFASVRILPPDAFRFRTGAAFAYAGRFLYRSVMAGADVARRVFDPALPVRPGMVAVPCEVPPGPLREAFRASTSLQPGTVPVGEGEAELTLHALDTALPVAADLATDARVFLNAFGPPAGARP